MLVYIGVCVLCLAATIISVKYFGPDNPVEEVAEEVIEEVVEQSLNLPNDTLNIDLTPEK